MHIHAMYMWGLHSPAVAGCMHVGWLPVLAETVCMHVATGCMSKLMTYVGSTGGISRGRVQGPPFGVMQIAQFKWLDPLLFSPLKKFLDLPLVMYFVAFCTF